MDNAKHTFLVSLLVVACASSPSPPPRAAAAHDSPPPAPAPATSDAATAKSAEPEPPAEAAPATESTTEKQPEPAPPEEGPKPSRSPRAIITATEIAFIIDYNNSAPKEAAEEKCDTEAEDDLAKRAACMTKARDEFLADVIRFKNEAGKWAMITYKRKSTNLIEVHTTTFDFGEEKGDTIELKPKGPEQGQRPLFKGSSRIVIKVPNDYSIEIDDPKFGHLRYDAKVGLVGR
jgi:hypothetical protein